MARVAVAAAGSCMRKVGDAYFAENSLIIAENSLICKSRRRNGGAQLQRVERGDGQCGADTRQHVKVNC